MDPSLGVPSKIVMQINSWRQTENNVELFVIAPKTFADRWSKILPGVHLQSYSTPFQRYLARVKTVELISAKNFSVVYMRFGVLFPAQLKLMRKIPTVLELNTLNKREAAHRGIHVRILNFVSEKFGLKLCLCACAVTTEIAKSFLEDHPKLVVESFSNSINFSDVPSLGAPNNLRPQLVFVGSPNLSWHGIDKLLKLAAANLQYDFHVIGALESALERINVRVHEAMYEHDLYAFLANMDVAISSLALERNSLHMGSPLKTRLYLACGLPVIASYQDAGIAQDAEFFLNLGKDFDASSDSISREISDFIKIWKSKRVPRSAISTIESSFIEGRRIDFIQKNLSDLALR
jgi:glycosyltransferase involved in cell wall biosynthesis